MTLGPASPIPNIKEDDGMGVYRRKDNSGKHYGPYIAQFPVSIDPSTGKMKYKAIAVGHSKRLANKIFAEKMLEWEKKKHLGLEKKKVFLFRELVEWYLGLPGTKSLKTSHKVVVHCQTLMCHFGNMLASEIKPHMIEEYLHMRVSQTNARGTQYRPASINREFEVMKRLFNLALREEMVEKNPCFKVSKIPANNERDRVLSYEEFSRLTRILPEHAANIVSMAYFTGMRFGEIAGLTWDRVNMKDGYISLSSEDTKTGKPRRVYLIPDAMEILVNAGKVRGILHNHVFTYKGQPVKSIKVALKYALEKTGIKDFRFHDLRHTFNTNMQRAGVKDTVTMNMTGHKTLSMFVRYSTIDPEDAKSAVDKFSDYLAREKLSTANSTAGKKRG